ncbi:MAG: hypothetical protein ACRD9R_18335 [Pyrinomonadaceae bacterium]
MNYFNYYTEIEEAFIRRRGKHLFLSPLDWALIESWKGRGVPLHVALRGVEQSFDSFEAKPRKRSVKSLFYCQEEVEAQFAEWLDSQRGAALNGASNGVANGGEAAGAVATNGDDKAATVAADESAGLPFPRPAILAHLDAAREELARATAERRKFIEDELCEAMWRAAVRVLELREDFAGAARPDAERLEAALTDLEKMLDQYARACFTPAELQARETQAAEQLKPYRTRMGREAYEQTLEHLLAKALREECGLPRLSLFYL